MNIRSFAENEYGLLTDALLCHPTYLPVKTSSTNHLEQYQSLITALEENQIKCHYIPEHPHLPYQCYTRDSSVSTPWGLLISRMGFSERHEEPNLIYDFAKKNKINIWEQINVGHFEGGDLLLLNPGHVAIGTNGSRTNSIAAQKIKDLFEDKGWKARIFEYPPIYVHLDVLLGVIDKQNIFCASEILKENDIKWLYDIGFSIHQVNTSDIPNLPCNFLALGNNRILCSQNNFVTNQKLKDLDYQIIEVDVGKFIEDSGGIHCLVHALTRK